jgi:multidrug efflux pump
MLVTGMIIGTAFTLFVVPSIYVLIARTHKSEAEEIAEEERVGVEDPKELVEAAS